MQTHYEFRITLLQQLKQLTPMFLLLVGIYGGAYYFIGTDLFNMNDGTFLYCSIAPLIICVIPALSVHLQYLIINWSAILIIDTENKKAVFKKSNKDVTFYLTT